MNQIFRLSSVILSLLTAFCVCYGQDIPQNTLLNEQRFFNFSHDLPEEVRAIARAIVRQNNQFRFVDSLVKRAGFPVWEKAIIVRKSSGAKSNHDGTAAFVYIPFTKDQIQTTQAVLAVALQKDTTYRMAYARDWCTFPFDTTEGQIWNAKHIFALFTLLDYRIYGHRNFHVSDGRLFGGNQPDKGFVTFLPESKGVNFLQLSDVSCFRYEVRRMGKGANFTSDGDYHVISICPPLMTIGNPNVQLKQWNGFAL
jgi:hypothetical protein